MIRKVMNYIEQQHMFTAGDVVVVGVSGGADSVCLLFVLLEIRKQIPMEIHVVHVNHQIREEAGEDEAFVKALCDRVQIPFLAVHEDVEAWARAKHITTEEAGREVRYQAFYDLLEKRSPAGHGKIAIAHNKNDSAETMLFNLFRGSGLKGLGGIAPVRDAIVRPLLCVERAEIEAYLQEIHQPFCTDATNLTDDYSRNRIRHHILQFAKDQICQEAIAHVQQAAEKLTAVNGLIERLTEKAYESCVEEISEDARLALDKVSTVQGQDRNTVPTSIKIQRIPFLQQEPVIQQQIVLRALGAVAGTRKDLTGIHVEDVTVLFQKQCGRRIDLPYQMRAERIYEGIVLYKRHDSENEKQSDYEQERKHQNSEEFPREAALHQEIIIPLPSGEELLISSFPYDAGQIIPQKTYTKWFDYDKIKNILSVRKRTAGDFFIINDQGQKQMLKSFFINEKIPREERDSIVLLAEGHHILWIVGSRISSFYKVSKDTRQILQVHLRGGKNDG